MPTHPDDLAPLLGPGKDPDLGMHQGVINFWDPDTGDNVVTVLGVQFTNLKMLNLTDGVYLREGDVVAVVRFKATWFIFGRIVSPGSPNFASTAVEFAGVGGSNADFGVAPRGVRQNEKATGIVDVPSWADEALVLCTANASVHNGTPTKDDPGRTEFVYCQAYVNGSPGGQGFSLVGPNYWAITTASAQRLITNPPSSFEVACVLHSDSDWGSTDGNAANVDAIAVFRQSRV